MQSKNEYRIALAKGLRVKTYKQTHHDAVWVLDQAKKELKATRSLNAQEDKLLDKANKLSLAFGRVAAHFHRHRRSWGVSLVMHSISRSLYL
jgi:DNA repair ATPase RecN